MDGTPRRRPRLPPASDAAAPLDTLPPELLSNILSRLSLRDAVRTSALSRAWRRRWETVPSLNFIWDDPHLECPRGVDPGAITRVLDHYSCPVRVFDCWEITDAASRHSDAWLRIMARKRLEFLTLFFGSGGTSIHTLHPSIFSCRDLAIIFLKHCDIPATPPGFAGLPRLTGLHLCDVAFVGEGARDLELLIATAPLLGHLHLVYLRLTESNGNPWVIQAPKLQEIRIVGGDRWWQVNDLPSIEVATIEDYDDHGFINLVTAVAAASQLTLDIPIGNNLGNKKNNNSEDRARRRTTALLLFIRLNSLILQQFQNVPAVLKTSTVNEWRE